MYSGPIKLPDPIKLRCYALINLGSMLQLFDITSFVRVIEVRTNIAHECLRVPDLQDIARLCEAVMSAEEVNDSLREEVLELSMIINLFIEVASSPTRPCGMWANPFVAYF